MAASSVDMSDKEIVATYFVKVHNDTGVLSGYSERQFSQGKLVFSDLRKSMQPRQLEMLMFLKANRKLWDINLVQEAYNLE